MQTALYKTKQDLKRKCDQGRTNIVNMVTEFERFKIIRDAPNIDSFNYVMTTITKCKSDLTVTTRVMEWLRLMEG